MAKKKKVAKVKKADKKEEFERLRNQTMRALADYDNLRKRMVVEIEDGIRVAKDRFIVKLLSVYDMLVNAQSHVGDAGIAIVIEEFKRVFEEEGVEEIKTFEGDKFDEKLHEAIIAEGTKDKKLKGTIKIVELSGWRFKDGPVIRPTKVKVYK